jgi:hypothetical protein
MGNRRPHTKDYNTNTKEQWRHAVWDYWRDWSGLRQIPKDKQYWTLGDVLLKDGQETGEVKAIRDYGLLEDMRSFISVNNEKKKSYHNIPACLECGLPLDSHVEGGSHPWVRPWTTLSGDIERQVSIAKGFANFVPALVNLDTTNMPSRAYSLAGKIGAECPPGTLMALNIIESHMFRKALMEEILGYTQNRSLEFRAKLHERIIPYQNKTCHLVTVFLEF